MGSGLDRWWGSGNNIPVPWGFDRMGSGFGSGFDRMDSGFGSGFDRMDSGFGSGFDRMGSGLDRWWGSGNNIPVPWGFDRMGSGFGSGFDRMTLVLALALI